jgi:hypothetical protein
MTRGRAALSIQVDVKSDGPLSGLELRLASVRRKLPALWDRAASALASGQEHLAGLALSRRRVLLRELDNLAQLIDAQSPNGRVLSRIEAADRLLDASVCEASRTGQPQPREPVALDLDPAVKSDLERLRAELRNETAPGPVLKTRQDQEGGA